MTSPVWAEVKLCAGVTAGAGLAGAAGLAPGAFLAVALAAGALAGFFGAAEAFTG